MGTRGKGEFDTGMSNTEKARLTADAQREANWKRWGPYLSERQAKNRRRELGPKGVNKRTSEARSTIRRWRSRKDENEAPWENLYWWYADAFGKGS